MKASAGLSGAANVAAASPKLRVSILVADARAAYTAQDLGVSASAVAPVIATSYALPVSSVAYIDLAAGVLLDTSGRFKFIPDSVMLVDQARLIAIKALFDSYAMLDAAAVSALKVLADNYEAADHSAYALAKSISNAAFVTDLIAVSAIYNRTLQDTQLIQDLVSLVLAKSLVDAVGLSDNNTVSTLKLLADGFAMNDGSEAVDGSVYSFAKGISNVAFVADLVTIAASYNRALQDEQPTQDLIALSAEKALADIFTLVDANNVSALKGVADILSAVDSRTHDFLKTLFDDATASDATSIDTERLLQEAQSIADLVVVAANKALADLIEPTDDKVVAALKGLSNSIEMQDSLTTLLVFLRNFADNVAVADVDIREYSLSKTEQVAVADNDFIDWAKNLAHNVAALDAAALFVEKPFAELVGTADAKTLLFALTRVESATVTDVGVVSIQDYCDLSYFAEDYVGFSQSF